MAHLRWSPHSLSPFELIVGFYMWAPLKSVTALVPGTGDRVAMSWSTLKLSQPMGKIDPRNPSFEAVKLILRAPNVPRFVTIGAYDSPFSPSFQGGCIFLNLSMFRKTPNKKQDFSELLLMAEIPVPTTWDVWNPINNGINYQPQLVIAGFQPSTVWPSRWGPLNGLLNTCWLLIGVK